jgi:hypothetical protein
LNHVTIWRWRHRFLTAAAHANAAMLCGVIEVEATFFRRSFKGSRLTIHQFNRQSQSLGSGRA